MRLSAALLALAIAAPAHAQGLLPFEIHEVHSATLNTNRSVFVSLPRDYGWSTKRHAVLVLLDANDTAQYAADVANIRFLESRGTIPSLIILGLANGIDRTRELTPAARDTTAKQFPTAGGADKSTAFITDELIPWADDRWRTVPMRILAGHSFGGLFALHALARKPDYFRVVIAMSPSIWWNDTTAVDDYAQAIARETRSPRTLFVTSGGLEGAIDRPTQKFVRQMEAKMPSSLTMKYARYPNDTHGLTPLPSLLEGIRWSFAPISMLADSAMNAQIEAKRKDSTSWFGVLRALDARYAAGARSLGMPTELPESNLDTFAAVMGFLGGPKDALPMRREQVRRYPQSVSGHMGLAGLLRATGDTAAARAEINAAVAAARPGDPAGDAALKLLATFK